MVGTDHTLALQMSIMHTSTERQFLNIYVASTSHNNMYPHVVTILLLNITTKKSNGDPLFKSMPL